MPNRYVVITFQPFGRKLEIQVGLTALEAARQAGVGLSAICGGQQKCGSCRIRITSPDAVGELTSTEKAVLTAQELEQGYRLACQTVLLNSITIEIPLESLTAFQRLQIEGEEQKVAFAPALRIQDISIPGGCPEDTQDDWHRVQKALKSGGISEPYRISLRLLRKLPVLLRRNDWKFSAVVRDNGLIAVNAPGTPVLGMAVDIGTTKIAGYLLDMKTGATLSQIGLSNPQIPYGEDVMTRISHAMQAEKGGEALKNVLLTTLDQLSEQLCRTARGTLSNPSVDQAVYPAQILEYVIVGNTVMHHLFLGLPVGQLGTAPFVPAVSESLSIPAVEIGLKASPNAMVYLMPIIAGFIGSDHVAMLLTSGINKADDTTLYIDIGTNTEITLQVNRRLIACSTASGPAFEGAHIRDGMRAGEGAIERVRIKNNVIHYQTIGGKKPIGICGSGIVDAIAQMRQAGIINDRGMFVETHPLVRKTETDRKVIIAPASETAHQKDIALSRKDVSEIQLAKAAIRAGIALLLKAAGITAGQVKRIVLAGAFGTYLDIDGARTIGLIPPATEIEIVQVGNAAGIGAKLALMSVRKRQEAEQIKERVEHLELSANVTFQAEYTKALCFDG